MLITKMLVNRLGSVLGSLISRFQNGFVPSRAISDNIMISHETLEFIRKKRSGKKLFFALKLDMDKAYDRVSWDFLLNMVRVMGFSQRWVNWIRSGNALPRSPSLLWLLPLGIDQGRLYRLVGFIREILFRHIYLSW